jgi:hypothetical protein
LAVDHHLMSTRQSVVVFILLDTTQSEQRQGLTSLMMFILVQKLVTQAQTMMGRVFTQATSTSIALIAFSKFMTAQIGTMRQ